MPGGEVACTGSAGRQPLSQQFLRSNAFVFGRRAARAINADFRPLAGHSLSLPEETERFDAPCVPESEIDADIAFMKELMTKNVDARATQRSLNMPGVSLTACMTNTVGMRLESIKQYTVFNAAVASTVIADSACKRTESIGSHYIVD